MSDPTPVSFSDHERGRALPLRWKRDPGGYNSESYRLRQGGVDLAIVARAPGGGWYSYGLSLNERWNTVSTPTQLELAKDEAMQRTRAALRKTGASS